jgi:hypothetical protein
MAWPVFSTAIAILFFQAQPSLTAADTRTCYDGAGKVQPQHVPCVNASTQASSHCCAVWDTCIGDNLCLSQVGTLFVATCTVQNWGKGNVGRDFCPKYCGSVGGFIGVCDDTADGWEFCCGLEHGHEACCAETYGKRFKITGNVTSQYVVQRPWLVDDKDAVRPASSAAPSTSAISSAQTSTCPSVVHTSSKMGAQIGLGVGLGVPLLIALGLLLWERRKRRRAEAKLGQQTTSTQLLRPSSNNATSRYSPIPGDQVTPKAELPASTALHELSIERRGYA